MADLQFNLTYAGVPFLNDDARTYQYSREIGEREGRSPVRKHQAEGWLWDEIERLIPTDYLQDFYYHQEYPGRNTGSLAQRIFPFCPPHFKLGDYYYPNTANKWSYYRGIATSAAAKAMLAATNGNKPKTFNITSEPISTNKLGRSYDVSTELYMLPPRPLGEEVGSFDGLYLITLVDERFFWNNNPVTLQPNFNTTWAGLISQIATALGVSIEYSAIASAYGSPEPDSHLWVNHEDAALLLDAVAFNIGRVVVRYYSGTYALLTPQESLASARTSRTSQGVVLREAGGDMFYSGSALPAGSLQKARNIAPTAVRITYPKYVTELPVPHFAVFRGFWSRWFEDSYEGTYHLDVPINSGGSLFSGFSGSPYLSGNPGSVSGNGILTIHNTAKALYNDDSSAESGHPTNLTQLQNLSQQIAQDYYSQNFVDGLDEVSQGILNWTPEGLHDILFSWSARKRLATTRVMRSEWNTAIRNMQHLTESYPWVPGIAILSGYTISNQGNSGVGLNLNLTNININGNSGSTTNIFVASGLTVNITGGDDSSFEWSNIGIDWTDVTIDMSNVLFNASNLITFNIQENSNLTFTNTGPNSILTIDLTTINWSELTTLTIEETGGLTITQEGNPANPLTIDITKVDLTENTFFVIEEGNTITINNSNPGGNPVTIDLGIDNLNLTTDLTTTIEDGNTWTIEGDGEESSFFVIQGTVTFPLISTLTNVSLSLTGNSFFDVSALLIVNGPLDIGYVTQDPITAAEDEFTILEVAPINRVPINADVDITGIAATSGGRSLWNTIINVGSGTGTFKQNLAGGSFAVATPGGQDMAVEPGGAVQRWYDPVSQLNRLFFVGGGGSPSITGFSGTKSVVTAVFCSGNTLTVTNETWYYQGGIFMSGG